MKNLFLLLSLFISLMANSQKNDFKWLLGYSTLDIGTDTNWGTTIIDFDTPDGNPLMNYDGNKKIDFYISSGIISDKDGRYLFSCNGYYVEDSSNKLMKYADNLSNDGGYANKGDGEAIPQGVLILPWPGKEDRKYIIFNKTIDYFMDYGAASNTVLYSIIEFDEKNPLGTMIRRKATLVADTLDFACLTAVKHANGRDWWILASEQNQIGYYTFLLNPIGVNLHHKLSFLGRKEGGGFGQSFFSNDGKYFATTTSSVDINNVAWNNLYFFSFDRCTGTLSDFSYIKFPYRWETWATGCSFSPDSKLLYVISADTLEQFEISKDNMLINKKFIDKYDGTLELVIPTDSFTYLHTFFGMMQSAPDGRIYGCSVAGSCKSMDVIHKPNQGGTFCDFKQHSVKSISVKTTLPNFPNFRLGPIDGSTCDTLGIDNIPWCHWRYNQDTTDYLNFYFTDLSAYEVETWYWDFDDAKNDMNTSLERHPKHRFTGNGDYNVCLIVKNKNGADTLCRTIKIGNVVSTENEKLEVEIHSFPNPCKDFLVVNVLNYNPEKMILQLYNELGQNVLTQKLYQGSNVLDIKSLNSGIFFLSIFEKGKEIKTESIVKR